MSRLSVKTGPDEGQVFPLTGETVKVGRLPTNDVVLSHASVSRYHAHLIRRADGYYLRDVGSALGTFLNGTKADSDELLYDGDLIRVGETELVFEDPEAVRPESRAPRELGETAKGVCPSGAEDLDESAIAFSLSSITSPAGESLSGRRSDMLSRVAAALQSVSDLEELLATLLDVIFDVFQPDRGMILLSEGSQGQLVPRVSRPDEEELVVSHTIVNYAIAQRRSVLVADTTEDERFRSAASIGAQSIRAAICSPLIWKDRVLGALYIDRQREQLTYRSEDVGLLNIIAANAAIAIENAILIREKFDSAHLAEDEPGRVIAESDAMRETQERIELLAGSSAPVLIVGESGTGRFFAAKAIHRAGAAPDAPFLDVDCQSIDGQAATKMLFGPEPRADFTQRTSHADAADQQAAGALQRADGGTLVLRSVGGLNLSSQEMLSQYLEAQASRKKVWPRTRVIATTGEDLSTLVEVGQLHAPLAARLTANRLEMPRLVDRKEDILPLAHYFLSKCDRAHEYEHEITKSAEHVLQSQQYRHRNVAELHDAIDFAVTIADGPQIGAEHIFTGPTDKGHRLECDLGGVTPVRWLARPGVAVTLQTIVLFFFLVLAAVCLTSGNTVTGRIANGLVWGLWWPTLMVLFLVAGRVWCLFCPLSRAGRIAQRVVHFNLRPPSWVKRWTGWIMAFLFFAIIWSEHVFRMPETPFATGLFLLTLIAFAVVLCVLYAREVWCRYVCPLGSLSAGYSVSSPIHVHSNKNICSGQCRTHECYKGNQSESGCPMYHHPLFVREAHFCKLCLSCIRLCPNQSAKLYLHPPLQGVWHIGDLSVTLLPVCLLVFFLSVIMLASHDPRWGMSGVAGFTIAACVAVGMTLAANAVLPRLLSRDRNLTVASRVAFALLLLAWGPLMAFHLQNIPGLGELRVQSAEESFLAEHFPSLQLSLLNAMQFAAILFSAILAAITFWRIRVHSVQRGVKISSWGWRLLLAVGAAYLSYSLMVVFFG